MRRSTQAVRIGLILYVDAVSTEHLIAVIKSIREQSQIPYYARIVFGGLSKILRYDKRVEQAIFELQQLVPNVLALNGSINKQDDLVLANNSLLNKAYDVLVIMDDSVALPKDTLFHLTNPYLWREGMLMVDAVVQDARYPYSRMRNWFARAMARNLIQGFFRVGKIGVLSAARKDTATANIGEISVPFWHEIHRYDTAEPRLKVYY